MRGRPRASRTRWSNSAGIAVLVEIAEPGHRLGIAGLAGVEQLAERADLLAALEVDEGGVEARQTAIAVHRQRQPPGPVEGVVVAMVGGAAIPAERIGD